VESPKAVVVSHLTYFEIINALKTLMAIIDIAPISVRIAITFILMYIFQAIPEEA
jgi:hypothetical protein